MENFGQYQNQQNVPSPDAYPLKWHKFLIYFALWAGAILNAVQAIRSMTGGNYLEVGMTGEEVYQRFSGLRTVDMVAGLLLLAIAAYGIYVRFQLAGFKIGAPAKLTVLYIALAAYNLIYSVLACNAMNVELSAVSSNLVGSMIGSVLMVVINRVYYNKRMELFVN